MRLVESLAAVALLCGCADEAYRRFSHVLTICPDDISAIDGLALAAEVRGELEQAEQLYFRLLDERVDPAVRAGAHASLGLIYQMGEQLDKAESMHQAALTIAEQLGRLADVANQLGQIGAVQEMRGQTEQAETMYRRALHIHEQLGRLEGMASQYVNLGLLASQRDDVSAARDLWGRARDLFSKAGLSGNARLVQQLLDELVVA